MFKTADLPETLPVFPLTGALLLPRARLPLHIFEPRYLAMLEDCMKTSARLIGMVQPNPRPGSTSPDLQRIGCAGRLTQFSETEDGRYMITLTGISRFRVLEEVDGFTPYRRANVSWSGFEQDLAQTDTDPGFDRERFLGLLGRYFETRNLSTDWDSLKQAEDELLVNSLSMLLDFEPEDKQALLEAPSLSTRRETLVTLIEFALRGGDERGTGGRGAVTDRPEETPHGFDRRMLEALVCPETQTTLSYDAARQELISRPAGLAYPIRDGIPVMLRDEARRLDD